MLALPILFCVPLVFSVLLFLLAKLPVKHAKLIGFLFSLAPLAFLVAGGDKWLGGSFEYSWLPALSIKFSMKADHLSLVFLYITNVIIPITIVCDPKPHTASFYGLILLLQGLLIGFFTSQDLLVFTFFFEAILLPAYLLIACWGGQNKEQAALQFIIYMIAGSCLMVLAVLGLYFAASTFDLTILQQKAEFVPYAQGLALIFLLAFAVKTPLFPLHSWLATSYSEAPTCATILLAAILSKAGIYGMIRILFGLFGSFMAAWSPIVLTLAITGVLYGAFCAWSETNFKRLIAYSSFSHVNFIVAGLFIANSLATSGALLMAVNHAVTICALFVVAGWLEERLGTTDYSKVSGLTHFMPKLSWLTLFFVLSSVALPGLNNFISEVMVLYGTFRVNPWLALTLGSTVVFSILYMLRFMHGVYFDEPTRFKHGYKDIKLRELCKVLPLIALILWIGIYPGPVLSQIAKTTQMSKK